MLQSKYVKRIIGAVGILAVLIISSICVTSIFKKTDVDDFNYSLRASADNVTSTSLTQIDYIIQETSGDNPYNVLIITDSSASAEEAQDFFKNDNLFRSYVVNDNRTIDEEMATGKVTVTVNSAASYKNMDKSSVADSLSGFDLIFLYAKGEVTFTGDNAISEDLYECLHNYISANKPMILSYYQISNTEKDEDTDDKQTENSKGYDSEMYSLTTQTFKNSWKRKYTYNVTDWTYDTTSGAGEDQVQGILKEYMSSYRSAYVKYSLAPTRIPVGFTDWQAYWSRVDGTPKLRVLYIYGGDENDASYQNLVGLEEDMKAVAGWMVSDGAKSVFNAPSASSLPTDYDVQSVCASELKLEAALGDDDMKSALYVTGTAGRVKQYDYIFIAPDAYSPAYDIKTENPDIKSELQKLSNATDSLTYILFGTLTGKTVTTTTQPKIGAHDPFSAGIDTTTNYGKLVDLCVTTTAYAKKSNVLPVGCDYITNLRNYPDKNPKKIAEIVALLNKSYFRTHAGSGSGGNSGSISTEAFRVLELEPCYPIDLELGVRLNSDKKTTMLSKTYVSGVDGQGRFEFTTPLGNYYTIPANVINSSEIDNYATLSDDGKSLVMNQEYYDWDLSKAKLAYALGINSDQIELVQMSTEEYITSKTDVSDAYDLIYIGGNMSALKNSNAYNKGTSDNTVYYSRLDNYAYYSMYTHTGEPYEIRGGRMTTNNPYKESFMNGNDITYDRYEQLIQYLDAGMPIVFSNEIWEKFEEAEAMKNPYANRYIDPDSNIYQLCKAAKAKKDAGATSVLTKWATKVRKDANDNFYKDYYVDAEQKVVANDTGLYGISDYVSVYKSDALNRELYDCVTGDSTNSRPRFSMTTTALAYVEGDDSTELTNHHVTWDLELLDAKADHTYKAYLLQDSDDNGVFVESGKERIGTTSFPIATVDGAEATAHIEYDFPANEFGAFNWKILVRDETTKASAATSVISCFAIQKDQDKMQASILEIMPMTQANCSSSNPSSPDGHTFYLDKNYQQSSGNPFLFSSYGTSGWNEYGYCPSIQSPGKGDDNVATTDPAKIFNSNFIAGAYKNGCFNNGGLTAVNMGKYKAELSVNRYDSAAGHEDRDYNYMDLVSDMYDFNLDIMYMDDILYYADQARKTTEKDRTSNLGEAEKAYAEYESYLPDYVKYAEYLPTNTTRINFVKDKNGVITNVYGAEITDLIDNKDFYDALIEKQEKGETLTNFELLTIEEYELRARLRDIRDGKSYTAKVTVMESVKVQDGYYEWIPAVYDSNWQVVTPGYNLYHDPVYEDQLVEKTLYTIDPSIYNAYGIDNMLNSRDYFRIFYLNTNLYNAGTVHRILYDNYYKPYYLVHDKMIEAYRKYRHFNMMAYGPEEYLRQNYDVIVIGFLDDYAGDFTDFSQGAADDLVTFSNDTISVKDENGEVVDTIQPGSILMTHDNMTAQWTSDHAITLTRTLRQYTGLNGFDNLQAAAGTESSNYPKYVAVTDSLKKKYFLSNVTLTSTENEAKVTIYDNLGSKSTLTGSSWNEAVNRWFSASGRSNQKHYPVGYTDIWNIYRTDGYFDQGNRYMYGELEMEEAIKYNITLAGPLNVTGTSKASQVNRGVVTTYPFYIASDLRVSNTHGQAFALDLENQDVAVWYTLAADNISEAGKAGGTNYSLMKSNSSLFAASPKDGVDSYYIYSIGNVVYCGAGHSLITGHMRDNNDERRLFLNVLINMAKKSTSKPSKTTSLEDRIVLYDPDGKTEAPGTVVKKLNNEYYINMTDASDAPEFGFKVNPINTGDKISALMFFYDLDYTSDQSATDAATYTDDENHVLINLTSDQIAAMIATLEKGEVVVITKEKYPNLFNAKQEYFNKYGGTYTYLVITMTIQDKDGNELIVTKRIKIQLARELLDLT